MELYDKYIYLGGGGGYEIANKIQVYTLPQDNLGLLKNLVHEENTNKQVANYMMAAKDVRNIISLNNSQYFLGVTSSCSLSDRAGSTLQNRPYYW